MTELQFLIELLLNHKLNATTKALLKERIGTVEESLRGNKQPIQAQVQVLRGTSMQAASTQALLDKEPLVVQHLPASPTPTMIPIPASAPALNRIVGGEVNTGHGSKGPRKW